MFEIDHPHAGPTFPRSRATAGMPVTGAGLDEAGSDRFLRGDAPRCHRLDRYGVVA
jgi:hypothetical protein